MYIMLTLQKIIPQNIVYTAVARWVSFQNVGHIKNKIIVFVSQTFSKNMFK